MTRTPVLLSQVRRLAAEDPDADRYMLGLAADDDTEVWWRPSVDGPLQFVAGPGAGGTVALRSLALQAGWERLADVDVLDPKGTCWRDLDSDELRGRGLAVHTLMFALRTGARLRRPWDPADAAAHRHPGRFLLPEDFGDDGRALVAEVDRMIDNAAVHDRIPDQVPLLEDHLWRIAEGTAAHHQAQMQGADDEALTRKANHMEISRGGPGKSRASGNPAAFPVPPGSVPIPEYTPKPGPSDANRFQVAAWMVPAYANGNNLDGSWATVAWTSTRTFADTIAEAFLNNGHLIVQIWHKGELVNERSNV